MARFAFRSFAIALAVASLNLTPVYAQTDAAAPAAPDIETSRYSFVGEVNADGAILRSGPNESDYGVIKLNKGTRLTVVGMRFDWLKVEPPENAYCLVSQAFVNRQGNGTTGKISAKGAVVRIGSALSQQKHRAPMQLEVDDTVTILGEDQEYFKIAPPKGVFMYVDKRFVDPVRRTDSGTPTTPGVIPTTTTPPTDVASGNTTGGSTSGSQTVTSGGGVSTTQQPTPGNGEASGTTPANDENKFLVKSDTPPTDAATVATATANVEAIRKLQDRLAKLEDRYAAAGQQDLTEQPLDALLTDYNALLAESQLPPNARKVAEFRAQQLQLRKDALTQYLETKKVQDEAIAKQKDLKIEEEELQNRVAAVAIKRYAAMGKLMQSSLQISNQTLYRLVDPATGRLIVYVRAAKAPVGTAVDKFIGVNGQVVTDDAMHLTYVQPDSFELVDPAQVNTKVFADYAPPSMATKNVATDTDLAGTTPNQ